MKKLFLIGMSAAMIIIMMIYIVIWFDAYNMERVSLENRIETLETQLTQKMHPIIQIQNASVYTAEGEIIIEEK